MEKIKKSLIALLGGVALLGLVGCGKSYIPCSNELNRIKSLHYEKGTFDCKHKSLMDHEYLESKGIDSKIIFGKLFGKMHIWEEVYNPETNTRHVRDAAVKYNTGGFEISKYPKRQRGKWGGFEKGATLGDIKNYNKIKEVYWKNVPKKHESFFKRRMKFSQ